MFDSKKVKALQKRIEELEAKLREETAAHEADQKTLADMRERFEIEERSFHELREACAQKLAAMDAQAEAYNERIRLVVTKLREQKERQGTQLEREALLARAALKKEIDGERARAHEETLERIKAFGDNYNYYLSQIKLMMDMLTKAALNTGATFLTSDEPNTEKLFRAAMAQKRTISANGEPAAGTNASGSGASC